MSKPILEMRNVTIGFNGKIVLENINLKIFQGESVIFIGPSGAGKSVLLKTLAGIIAPLKGEVLIEGEDWQKIENKQKHDLARKVGMLFQQSALFDTLTTLENVEFPMREHEHLTEKEMKDHSIELLKRVNLADALDKLPGQLSGGMQRRLGIARALALNPSVVFYDDPVAGQDPIQSDQVSTLIKELKEKNNSTIVMVTSNMRVAFKMASRIFMVIDNTIIEAGSPVEAKKFADKRFQQFIHGELEGPISIKR